MRLREGAVTRQQKAFAEVMAATGDPTYAAAKAGYAYPTQQGIANLERPAIQAAIRERELKTLTDELLPLATAKLRKALTDDVVPWGAAMKAVEIVHKRVFGEADSAASKDPSEYTGDELNLAIQRLQREAAARAKPILEHEESIPKPGAFD